MASEIVGSIECSAQPLDFSFHTSDSIVATALVDGTLELHDYSLLVTNWKSEKKNSSKSKSKKKNDDKEYKDSDDKDENVVESDDESVDDTILSSISLHGNHSCRVVLFSSCGTKLYTAGSDGAICCLNFNQAKQITATMESSLLWRVEDASPFGINRLYEIPNKTSHSDGSNSKNNPTILVSGDDEGIIRFWNIEQCESLYSTNSKEFAIKKTKKQEKIKAVSYNNKNEDDDDDEERIEREQEEKQIHVKNKPKGCVASFANNRDYITDFAFYKDTVLASSSDGTLSAYRVSGQYSKFTLVKSSDDQEDELLSMVVMKNGKKVVSGTTCGVLNVWSFGTWGDVSDRFPGHPQSIDALLKIDEDTLLTGCSDGYIRAVQIHPDQLLGVIGYHDNGYPIETLRFSSNRAYIGSISHDEILHLWDASILSEDADNDSHVDDDDSDKGDKKPSAATDVKNTKKTTEKDSEDDWEDESDDDDDDDDDSFVGGNRKKKPKLMTESEKFFSDL